MRTSPPCHWSDERSPGSRSRNVRTCQGLRPRRVLGALAVAHPPVLHSALRTASAAGISKLSRLNGWLARTLPYRRFADLLTNADARLGADVVRYSFIVVDLHHLLLAGFYRRTLKDYSRNRRAQRYGGRL